MNSKYTGEASILAIIMMIFGVAIMFLNQMSLRSRKNYTTVTGKSGQTSKINLGRAGKYIIAAVLIVISLVARVQLSQASAQVSALEDQYTQLQEDQTRLRIDYESAFNLTEIEDYAIHELGMQKPRSDQLYYISSSDAADTAVVLDQNAAEPLSLADRLGDFFSSIVEYFR